MRICSPHCGIAPETTSGGETYERELLERLGRAGVRLEIILARGKPHPVGVPNWTIHRFAIARGLRWYVAPLVVPSVWPEPLSRVLLEAMRIGRPVVATAVGGTPEAVEHGVTGLLVPRQDPEALAKAVIELLLDPERRERMGRAAVERAATAFSESRLVDALLDAYREAGAA